MKITRQALRRAGPLFAVILHMAAIRTSTKTETQVSAGGATLRRVGERLHVAIVSVGKPARWQLPKGLVDEGETPEQAALREVREEAGVVARIDRLVDKVEYWYQAGRGAERVRYHKFVYFYLMWFESGDVGDHDHEVNESRWVSVSEAISLLAFRSERTIVEQAAQLAG